MSTDRKTVARLREMMDGCMDEVKAESTVLWAADRIEELEAEVQDSRRRLAAIRALPDDGPTHPDDPDVYWSGYRYAMRQVKALLDGES